jgi:cell division protein ZapA (FtsZ GTPase activity inhibitor)
MSIVTIKVANRNFRLSCPEDSKPQLDKLAEMLDLEICELSKNNPSASFETLLIIASLGLLEEKYSKNKESGGKILEEAENNYQKQLTSIFHELKDIVNKF